jgi:hypothetical protein
MRLFDKDGNLVHTTVPFEGALTPGIIIWQGRYFRLDAGRYVESGVHYA